jgi:putative glutamine amidotransferase
MELSYKTKNLKDLKKCNGLVLTGGVDIHPGLYGKEAQISLCGDDINISRDIFELELLSIALMEVKTIFGICRGMQFVNSSPFFSGNLLCDIKTELTHSQIVHSNGTREGSKHSVKIIKNTILNKIVKNEMGEVNSFHHQAVDKIGKGFKISSYAQDGIIESLERKKDGTFPYILLVQWHPERMPIESELAGGILNNFYENILTEQI